VTPTEFSNAARLGCLKSIGALSTLRTLRVLGSGGGGGGSSASSGGAREPHLHFLSGLTALGACPFVEGQMQGRLQGPCFRFASASALQRLQARPRGLAGRGATWREQPRASLLIGIIRPTRRSSS
jgi:hypothetical protein